MSHVKSRICLDLKGLLFGKAVVALVLFSVGILLISIGNTEASTKNNCPSQLYGILYTFSSGSVLLDNSNYMLTIPTDWDSSNGGTYYSLTPCQNADVHLYIQSIALDPTLSTEQQALGIFDKFAQTKGYNIIRSQYFPGTSEYSVVGSHGDSESPSIWQAFIPIDNGRLIIFSFQPANNKLYEKYGGIARSIYDSIRTISDTQKAELIQMVTSHNQFMGNVMTGIQETRQQALHNWLDIMQDSVKFDRKIYEENEKYQREREQGLRP